MRVIYWAVEVKPFCKEGGVGDVAGELPVSLKRLGIDVTILTVLYGRTKPEQFGIRPCKPETSPREVVFNGNRELVEWHQGEIKDGDVRVPVYFLRNQNHFDGQRNGEDYSRIYVESKPPKPPYWDDALRFSFFAEASVDLIERLQPDIVHGQDWPAGYLFGRMRMRNLPQKLVLTVHNVGYQGNMWWKIATDASSVVQQIWRENWKWVGNPFFDPRYRAAGDEHNEVRAMQLNVVNPLRLALELSHAANAVSPNYCREMTQVEDPTAFIEGGKGLHETAEHLRANRRLRGILNGFVYKNAPTDEEFRAVLSEKQNAKERLSAHFANKNGVLIGFVGRAVDQKFRLLSEYVDGKSVIEHILELPDVNVAIVATGEQRYESFISGLRSHRWAALMDYDASLRVVRRQNCFVTVAFDRELARLISLGCDLFLMPSLYEPCGITQMEAMSTATPPLVRWTGGLVDTVSDETGFGFDGKTRTELLHNLITAVKTASRLHREKPDEWKRLQRNCFDKRFNWEDSAKEYFQMYEEVLAR